MQPLSEDHRVILDARRIADYISKITDNVAIFSLHLFHTAAGFITGDQKLYKILGYYHFATLN